MNPSRGSWWNERVTSKSLNLKLGHISTSQRERERERERESERERERER